MRKWILVLITTLTLSQAVSAQVTTGQGMVGLRRGLATVMLAGLGGAVLGLSTLSFYGEPQDHINNIWAGLAIGALGGTAYVVTQHQNQSALASESAPKVSQSTLGSRSPNLFAYAWEF